MINSYLIMGEKTSIQDMTPPVPITTQEQFKWVFEKTKEATASSLSGVNIAHYKVATHNELLSEILALQMSIPFRHKISLPMWEHSLHVMIEKSPGVI